MQWLLLPNACPPSLPPFTTSSDLFYHSLSSALSNAYYLCQNTSTLKHTKTNRQWGQEIVAEIKRKIWEVWCWYHEKAEKAIPTKWPAFLLQSDLYTQSLTTVWERKKQGGLPNPLIRANPQFSYFLSLCTPTTESNHSLNVTERNWKTGRQKEKRQLEKKTNSKTDR